MAELCQNPLDWLIKEVRTEGWKAEESESTRLRKRVNARFNDPRRTIGDCGNRPHTVRTIAATSGVSAVMVSLRSPAYRPGQDCPVFLTEAVAHYALGNLANMVLAREYKLTLPEESILVQELAETRRSLQNSPRTK